MILKRLWQKRGKEWDSNISSDLNDGFHSCASALNAGEPFDVQRWHRTTDEALKNEMHVFGDNSEDAFCTVAYIVSENSAQERDISLVIGKALVIRIHGCANRKSFK